MKISRDRYYALRTAVGNILGRQISLCDDGTLRISENKVKFLVNWAALGDTSPEETRKYAQKLVQAAGIAELLNGLDIEIDWAIEDGLDENGYDELSRKLGCAIAFESVEHLERLLTATYCKVELTA